MTETVVVTGAGSGIGREISAYLAQRGYRVVVTDINEDTARATAEALPVAGGVGHTFRGLNVTDALAANDVATWVSETYGLNGWVSNAGISKMMPFLDISPEQLDLTLAINLKGVFICGQAAARAMVAAGGGGRIVNTASMAGKQGRVPYLSDYVASKFGVVGLTQAMAFELAQSNITVNSVCPGYVATPMQARELQWEADLRGITVDEVRKMYLADTPLNRLEAPNDVAKAVAFLLSDEASFITGEALSVNGGAYMD